jgi:hypothetical protein
MHTLWCESDICTYAARGIDQMRAPALLQPFLQQRPAFCRPDVRGGYRQQSVTLSATPGFTLPVMHPDRFAERSKIDCFRQWRLRWSELLKLAACFNDPVVMVGDERGYFCRSCPFGRHYFDSAMRVYLDPDIPRPTTNPDMPVRRVGSRC